MNIEDSTAPAHAAQGVLELKLDTKTGWGSPFKPFLSAGPPHKFKRRRIVVFQPDLPNVFAGQEGGARGSDS